MDQITIYVNAGEVSGRHSKKMVTTAIAPKNKLEELPEQYIRRANCLVAACQKAGTAWSVSGGKAIYLLMGGATSEERDGVFMGSSRTRCVLDSKVVDGQMVYRWLTALGVKQTRYQTNSSNNLQY